MRRKTQVLVLLILIALQCACIFLQCSIIKNIWDLKEIQKDTLELTNRINAEVCAREGQEVYIATGEITAEPIGVYKISHYCACEKCCGKSDGITASGTIATEGRTCAAEGLPIGTHLLIVATGEILTVEDRFGDPSKTGRIDIFISDHERAKQLGLYDSEIFIINY